MVTDSAFWRTKKLTEMTEKEWESLCDGCGLCCLHKLEDEDTGAISYTDVACRLLDTVSCQCKNYPIRKKLVPDCVVLTPDQVPTFPWLPKSCAYRLVSEGKDLNAWHPLVSGSKTSVHDAGISVQGRVVSERDAGDLENHIVDWTGE
ncbi:MAG: YcgN family cysteine cluster protein [Emcibacter sp.]|nr:YcgN family cysteine cluster protein [Emcibacter sp.]